MNPELYNGQCWKQEKFPYFEIMVLMLVHIKGKLRFCKVAIDHSAPLIMTESYGKKKARWMYSEDALLKQLHRRKYTPCGFAYGVTIRPEKGASE